MLLGVVWIAYCEYTPKEKALGHNVQPLGMSKENLKGHILTQDAALSVTISAVM